MSRYKYMFVNDKHFHYTGNHLAGNPRIIKFDPYIFPMNGLKIPNPSYESVAELVCKDRAYKEFKKLRHSTALLIAMEENINFITKLVLSDDNDDDQAGNMIKHVIEGNRKSKDFTGVHHLSSTLPKHIVNLKIIDPPNHQGVYTASFDIISENGKVLSKKDGSTLFPSDWTEQKVYDECLYALKYRVKQDDSGCYFRSTTHSGIPVEIFFDNEGKRITTLYPIRL